MKSQWAQIFCMFLLDCLFDLIIGLFGFAIGISTQLFIYCFTNILDTGKKKNNSCLLVAGVMGGEKGMRELLNWWWLG